MSRCLAPLEQSQPAFTERGLREPYQALLHNKSLYCSTIVMLGSQYLTTFDGTRSPQKVRLTAVQRKTADVSSHHRTQIL
jgi:hypothetical protein